MKTRTAIVLTCVACIFIMGVAGCGGKETPSVKKSRLIASENRELLKTIEQKDEEIATLKQEHAREMAKQEELLEKCRDERDALNKRLKGQIEQQVSGVLEAVMNDNKALRDQVAQLQAKVEELQAKVNSN